MLNRITLNKNALNKIVTVYKNCLPPFLTYSVFSSYISGMTIKSSGPGETFEHFISYTTLGIAFGVFYPITYPMCACYTLYKNVKEH
jgi:hypothetical protein